MATTGRTAKGAAAFLVALSLLAALPAVPALGTSPTACRVRNLETRVRVTTLQAAVTAAAPGDRLTVRGLCTGSTLVDRDLTISGVRPAGAVRPTLDGEGIVAVIEVDYGVSATIERLTIANGLADFAGGGLVNRGTLTLRGVVVRGGNAQRGGGIYNAGTLTLTGSSVVRDNLAALGGGGVFNAGTLILTRTTAITGNTGPEGGGVLNANGGTLRLTQASSIHDNTGTSGGGVHNSYGTIELIGKATIRDNAASGDGGGVVHVQGTLTLAGASAIRDNSAGGTGGGVFIIDGTVSPGACGTRIRSNSPDDCTTIP